MTHLRNFAARLGACLAVLQSASAVVRSVESNRRPLAADLRRLGIDPIAFGRIGHG